MNTIVNKKTKTFKCIKNVSNVINNERHLNKSKHNQKIIYDIMNDWKCTELEAMASIEMNCDSLNETIKAIQMAVTYKRYLISLLPSAIQHVKNAYKDLEVTDNFILLEAKELVESQANQFVFDWDFVDDYDDMSESEKETALFSEILKI